MVVIAQLAEHRIVVPSVVGSSPTIHPKKRRFDERLFCCIIVGDFLCCIIVGDFVRIANPMERLSLLLLVL